MHYRISRMRGTFIKFALLVFGAFVMLVGTVTHFGNPTILQTMPKELESKLSSALKGSSRPNILWIVIDCLRADHLSCYGYDRPTSPVLDMLAGSGTLFENHFAQGPSTWLSSQSYLTGRYFPTDVVGYGDWRSQSRVRPGHEVLVSELMRSNGYRTVAVSANPFVSQWRPSGKSFDECFLEKTPGKAHAEFEQLNQRAIEWMTANQDQPFFMYMHTMDVHRPLYVRPEYSMWEKPEHATRQSRPEPPFSRDDQSYVRGEYDSCVRLADAGLGELLSAMNELGRLQDTVILIGADHGELLSEDGASRGHPGEGTVDNLLHVPLVMTGPGIPKGLRVSHSTENVDIIPTLIDILGLTHYAQLDGTSLLPAIHGEMSRPKRSYTFSRALFIHEDIDTMPICVLRGDNAKLVWEPKTRTANLWNVPDLLGEREDIADARPELLRKMRGLLDSDLIPLWQAYESLPRRVPAAFRMKVATPFYDGLVSPEGSYERNGERRYLPLDEHPAGKWVMLASKLESAGWNDAAPIHLRFEVPNGTYRVFLCIHVGKWDGRMGSSFLVKAEHEETFRVVAPSKNVLAQFQAATSLPKYQYMEIGTYQIEDGFFDITLDEGNPDMWATCREVRFQRVGQEKTEELISPNERDQEQLEALGYL